MKIIQTTTEQLEKIVQQAIKKAIKELKEEEAFKKWPEVMSTKEAQDYLVANGKKAFKDSHKLYYLHRSGAINVIKQGGRNGFPKKELDDYLNGLDQDQ